MIAPSENGAGGEREDHMPETDAWREVVREAAEELGHRDPGIPRTVAGIQDALRPELRDEFLAELGTLSDGGPFEVFLDHWWTQVVVDAATDEQGRDAALDFADLAVSLRILSDGRPPVPTAEVEALISSFGTAEAQ